MFQLMRAQFLSKSLKLFLLRFAVNTTWNSRSLGHFSNTPPLLTDSAWKATCFSTPVSRISCAWVQVIAVILWSTFICSVLWTTECSRISTKPSSTKNRRVSQPLFLTIEKMQLARTTYNLMLFGEPSTLKWLLQNLQLSQYGLKQSAKDWASNLSQENWHSSA